jgi:hypothetical protein
VVVAKIAQHEHLSKIRNQPPPLALLMGLFNIRLARGAAMSLKRHVLANAISDAKAESKTDRKDNCEIHRVTLFYDARSGVSGEPRRLRIETRRPCSPDSVG